jgi:predicted acylesterase/phospholipase RssA
MSSKNLEIGVVLQGGGALGAYECGALNALLELMDEFAAQGHETVLKVVTGVSIGSINAACVVGAKSNADARARLNALWDDLTLETPPFWSHAAQRDLAYFGLPGFYVPRPDFWTAPTWTYVYDTRPLLVTLGRHVDFAALNASATAFAVTAVEVVTGTLRAFVNQPLGKVPATKIEPRHVLASGSLPPGFPWTEIDGMPHWDGGLVDNTPLGLAIDAFSTDPDIDRMLVVVNLYPLRARLPRNLAAVEDRVHELSFGNRLRQDHDTARRINALVETIDDLAALVPPDGLDDRLRARLHEARRYKIISYARSGRAEPGRRQGRNARFLPGDRGPAAPGRIQICARDVAASIRESQARRSACECRPLQCCTAHQRHMTHPECIWDNGLYSRSL